MTRLGNKRVLPNYNSQRSQKRKKILIQEEEDEEEEMKEEPTTPIEENEDVSEESITLPNNDNAVPQHEEQIGRYNKIIYAPLVVRRQPPPTTALPRSARGSNGVNYKKFKKVRFLKKHFLCS
jgi:hypothetical protein